ncbi:MAG: lactate utilization protein [Spirochaetaceae bacterium]|jgi:L-lactate utilization protein LutB|nr:lactate utilization protein [Spirochaetaceae bacterium]
MNISPQQIRNAKLGPKVAQALKDRGFDAWYCSTREEGTAKILSLIAKTDTVSWGGSITITDLGIQERLAAEGIRVIDRDAAPTKEERHERMRQALLCDTFLTSSNAVSEDGQLVNIDGFGNRVAAMLFGPKQVIAAVGMNKVVKTAEDALIRARTIAGPLNMQRFQNLKTPCAETGACGNCKNPDSICSYIVTTRRCKPAGRIKVILIGEDLGL